MTVLSPLRPLLRLSQARDAAHYAKNRLHAQRYYTLCRRRRSYELWIGFLIDINGNDTRYVEDRENSHRNIEQSNEPKREQPEK